MPRFFIDYEPEKTITVTGSDASHIIKSLRMKTGDEITFCRNGTDYLCLISSADDAGVFCEIIKTAPSGTEPSADLTLYQALPKAGKIELIIQKTVELGVKRIVPFISERCVARPDEKGFAKRLERYRKISEEAAKQSGRGVIPYISPLLSFDEVIADTKSSELRLMCYENGGKRLSEAVAPSSKSISVIIGSEGGFERGEVNKAAADGIVPVWLGERILRCETCPIAVTAIIMNLTGNM